MNLALVLVLVSQLNDKASFEIYSEWRRSAQAHRWHLDWALQKNDQDLARESIDRIGALRKSIDEMMDALPEDSRMAFEKHYFETRAFDEIPSIYKGKKWLLPDRTSKPIFAFESLEVFATFDFPVEHLCVSKSGRVFADLSNYDSSNPIKVVELYSNGWRHAFPAPEVQRVFGKIRSLRADSSNRLWVLDARKKLLGERVFLSAFDLDSGEKVFEDLEIPSKVLNMGSYPNDAVVDSKYNLAIISDSSPLPGGGTAALIVIDLNSRISQRILSGHYSVQPAPFQIQHNLHDWKVFGIFAPKIGVDGIAINENSGELFFAPGNQGNLYKLNTKDLGSSAEQKVLRVGRIPMTDGIEIDSTGGVLLTDFEHSAIVRWVDDPGKLYGGRLETLVKDPRLQHLSSVGVLSDGSILFTGNPIEEILFANREQIRRLGPFKIYRLKL